MDSIIVVFEKQSTHEKHDLEIPTYIQVSHLLQALDSVYHLGIDFDRPEQLFLRAENPSALLTGEHLISEYGLHNGTRLYY